MKVLFRELRISTKDRTSLVDITSQVEDFVRKSEIKNGMCLVYAPHATAAFIVNEHESGLMTDIINKIKELYPRDARYLHNRIDDNADSHLASAFITTSRVFPVRDGELIRGVWQNIFLLELDGPRTRRVVLEAIGE